MRYRSFSPGLLGVVLALAATCLPTGLTAQTEPGAIQPLVIVVHGIGGGNRDPGWSNDMAAAWKIGDVQEVTYRYEGRGTIDSFRDFGRNAQDWGQSVQDQLITILSNPANKDRPVVIVSHSWGTVMTKLALNGGATSQGTIEPIGEAARRRTGADPPRVTEWFTLGSPIGSEDRTNVPIIVSLRQIGVEMGQERPPIVNHWTNMYDRADYVAGESHNLAGADENLPVDVSWSESWVPVFGPHTGMWTTDAVTKRLRQTYEDLTAPQLLTVDVSEPGSWGSAINNATVSVTGPATRQAKGMSPLFLEDLPPGRYRLRASAPGHNSVERLVTVIPGRNRVKVEMAALPAATGSLSISGPDSIKVGEVATMKAAVTSQNAAPGSLYVNWAINGRVGSRGLSAEVRGVSPGTYDVVAELWLDQQPQPVRLARVSHALRVEAANAPPAAPPPIVRPPIKTEPGVGKTGAVKKTPTAEDILAEYRSLYPAYVRQQYKSPGQSVEMRANASASGDGYLCSYILWDVIKDGPRKGERYKAIDFSRTFTLNQLSAQLVGMRKALGKID